MVQVRAPRSRRPHGARARSDGPRHHLLPLVLALALGVLGACTSPEDEPEPSPGDTSTPTESPEPSPSPSETVTTTVAVWFMVDTRAGLRLARELHDIPAADSVQAAVEQMIAGADDPDYATAWNPATEVLGVTQESGLITVDLSEDARTANIGSEGAALMIQQLVWTASSAVGDPAVPVLLTIEGEPAGELWGVVEWTEPVTRAEAMGVRVLVQIDEPSEGAPATSPVTVRGEANVFEATLPWAVLDASGTEVQTGFAMTAAGQEFAPYSFTVELEPGTWTIVITEDDPSGGEGGTPMSDSRTVVVE